VRFFIAAVVTGRWAGSRGFRTFRWNGSSHDGTENPRWQERRHRLKQAERDRMFTSLMAHVPHLSRRHLQGRACQRPRAEASARALRRREP